MIPEAGNRTELKRAVINAQVPLVGEVYRYQTQHIDEFWRVVDVNVYRTLTFVHYQTYVSYFHASCYDKGVCDSTDLVNWQHTFYSGKLRYHGPQLPPVVDMHD